MSANQSTAEFDELTHGANAWLVDDMRAQWSENPASVGESWRNLFEAGLRGGPAAGVTALVALIPAALPSPPSPSQAVSSQAVSSHAASSHAASSHAAHTSTAPPPAPSGTPTDALRGAAARIVANMEASLGVPTATSVRDIPAKLLEVQRNIINNHLKRTRGGKVSFTHIIGFAIVKALADVPAMCNTYTEDAEGRPRIVRHPNVGLGIAVDIANADGSRSLFVPCIRSADTLGFSAFHAAYEALIAKVRGKKLSADDLAGVTVSITNPGTIGTRHSVPRLMPGQAVIVGVGSIDYPAEFAGADLTKLAEIGVGKVVTLTSTYDHRIIQGAESGLFLDRVRAHLMGEVGFYDEVFASLGVPYVREDR